MTMRLLDEGQRIRPVPFPQFISPFIRDLVAFRVTKVEYQVHGINFVQGKQSPKDGELQGSACNRTLSDSIHNLRVVVVFLFSVILLT